MFILLQGADIVIWCIDSESGTTSQPAMGAIMNSLQCHVHICCRVLTLVDCCIDSMSGTTSQPAMGTIVNSLLFTACRLHVAAGC